MSENLFSPWNKIKNLYLLLIVLVLSACGGGGGGGGSSAIGGQPVASYTDYVTYINNGGSVPNAQGRIFRSRGEEYNSPYQAPATDFAEFSSTSLQYSVPDANGNQAITLSGSVNWDGNPFSGSEIIAGTVDSSDGRVYRFSEVPEYYNKLWGFFDQMEDNSSNDPDSIFNTWSVAFADFDDSPRTVEKTKFVTQFGQFRQQYSDNVGFYGTQYSYNYDLVVFVMGDPTRSFDMPSGTATFNGFTQMWQTYENRQDATINKAYLNGTATFTVNFSSRQFSGTLDFNYGSWADSPHQTSPIDGDFILELNGNISGTSFTGTVVNPNLIDTSANITSSFSGSFFGPQATELGGTFNYSNVGFQDENGNYSNLYRIGSFTGCQGC